MRSRDQFFFVLDMSKQIISTTIQAMLFSALSNVIAQGLTAVRERNFSNIDPVPFIHFVLFSLLTTPPNFLWQQFLEEKFPASPPPSPRLKPKADDDVDKADWEKPAGKDGKQKLSVVNTAIKLVLDQSVGAAVNTMLFIVVMGFFRTLSFSGTGDAMKTSFWPMLLAGYNVWPVVALLNLTVIPFQWRFLFGSVIGVIWGVYVNLMGV